VERLGANQGLRSHALGNLPQFHYELSHTTGPLAEAGGLFCDGTEPNRVNALESIIERVRFPQSPSPRDSLDA
jgi:hypothetical protein